MNIFNSYTQRLDIYVCGKGDKLLDVIFKVRSKSRPVAYF